MDVWILAAVLTAVAGLAVSLRHLNRPRRCLDCGETTEPVTRDLEGGFTPVVEIAFWCPRCARVVARRCLTVAFD
jgi:predicted RNA-binding Zn-ribbon protein involved in translation (DUF1610 family)